MNENDAAESVPPSSSTDAGTSSNPPATPDLLAKLDAASDRALNAAGSTPPKRKPGQRGPDKNKRRPKIVPVGEVDGSTAETLFETSESLPDSQSWSAVETGLDDETATALADVVYELFVDGRSNFWRLKVIELTGSKEIADNFCAPISPKLESAMRKSAKALVLKYGAQIEYAPEITFLGAAAVIVVGDFLRFRGLKADAAKMRGAA